MYQFSYRSPKFAKGDTVTNGEWIGTIDGRVWNKLLGREHTDRWHVIWRRDLDGKFLPRGMRAEINGISLKRYTYHQR